LGIGLLFIGTLCLGYFIANLDPFLHIWDEQYHALVAKNLAENFLKPLLYSDPVLDYNYKHWPGNHVWLHKQPLFLWQIAVSIKLFGTTEFAVRFPSIIMHAIIPLFIYRIGKIAINKDVGFYGALLFATAYFPLELVAGRFSTDHNDVAFLFYVTASFWAWFEYTRTEHKYWLILIGLFSGCAVLVKWLMGLLIYVIWAFQTTIIKSPRATRIRSYVSIVLSGLISIVIFLPWQIYAHLNYPKEASYEAELNSRHMFEAVEDHFETTLYYFTNGLNHIYGSGDLVPFIILLGVILFVINVQNKGHQVFVVSGIVFVYLFYTFARTKMVSFPIIVAPFVYLGLGYLIYAALARMERAIKVVPIITFIAIVAPSFVAFTVLNLSKIQNTHTMWKPHDNGNRMGELAEMSFVRSLDQRLKGDAHVIFNASITQDGHISMMYFTDHVVYGFIPNKSEIAQVKSKNRQIAILNLGNLPAFIKNDSTIKILDVKDKELLTINPLVH
jgi:4-amino-4-deoxy-L-arabinose transferase-like glycosyltransferase